MSEKKPNGRPRKRPENQRTQVMHVRMTERESAQLSEDAAAMNLTKTDFIRHRLWGKTSGPRKANPERAEVIRAIRIIGFVCHDLRATYNPTLDKELRKLVDQIKLKLSKFPQKDDPLLYDSLRNLSNELLILLTRKPETEKRNSLSVVLEDLSRNLMDFLNASYSRKTKR